MTDNNYTMGASKVEKNQYQDIAPARYIGNNLCSGLGISCLSCTINQCAYLIYSVRVALVKVRHHETFFVPPSTEMYWRSQGS